MKQKGLLIFIVALLLPLESLWAQTSKAGNSILQRTETPIAIKTNVLYDAFTLVNVSAEVGLGNRWSLSLEAVAPWWDHNNHGKVRTTRMLLFGAEGRYYLHEWAHPDQAFQGWYAGVYAYGGKFDVCRWSKGHEKSRGYQGNNLLSAGVNVGYTYRFAPHWRLDFTLGLGYVHADYKHYDVIYEKYRMKHYSGSYNRFMPTKAGISISWMFNQCLQRKQKGGAK